MFSHITRCISFTIEFNTVHINGLFGTPTPPHAASGMIKTNDTIEKVLKYVRTFTPTTHKLVEKGWTALPVGQWELPDEVAVPDGSLAAVPGAPSTVLCWALRELKLEKMPVRPADGSPLPEAETLAQMAKNGTANEIKAAKMVLHVLSK